MTLRSRDPACRVLSDSFEPTPRAAEFISGYSSVKQSVVRSPLADLTALLRLETAAVFPPVWLPLS
jgi:hypothetical protein